MNKAITVQYAFKKDGKGERHGTPAERLLAAQARKNNALPINARPPPVPPMAFAGPGPYQGQFAGALAAQPPPPPPGFGQGVMYPPQGIMPPMGTPQPYVAPPSGLAMLPPPPPGFSPQNMGMMPPPPPPPVSH